MKLFIQYSNIRWPNNKIAVISYDIKNKKVTQCTNIIETSSCFVPLFSIHVTFFSMLQALYEDYTDYACDGRLFRYRNIGYRKHDDEVAMPPYYSDFNSECPLYLTDSYLLYRFPYIFLTSPEADF